VKGYYEYIVKVFKGIGLSALVSEAREDSVMITERGTFLEGFCG